MSSKKTYQLSPEQLALSIERKAKKQAQAAASKPQSLSDNDTPIILERPWLQIPNLASAEKHVRVLTFNLLAQSLVRRELFPTSGNSLKEKDRMPMLQRELMVDDKIGIICMQEVDRIQKLAPILEEAGFDYIYSSGIGKAHGCVIAFKKALYTPVGHRTIFYDDQEVSPGQNGLSFKTRNIGLLVALRNEDHEKGTSIIVATSHLFWHPRYTYERARQALILLREVNQFRADQGVEWPSIIAGDFNFSPEDAAYSLIRGNALTPEHRQALAASRVVHVSVDPSVPKASSSAKADDEGGEDPDRVITNARPAKKDDGLLTDDELLTMSVNVGHVRSAYDEALRVIPKTPNVQLVKDRITLPDGFLGGFEPRYTAFAHYWKTTLDYIFFKVPRNDVSYQVTGVLAPHKGEDLEPGLPQKGVCGSDHFSLSAEISEFYTES